MALVKKVKCIRGPKNAGIILGNSGTFQVRRLLTWSSVSQLLQGKSKLATGKNAPSSQRTTEVPNECKPPQRNDENVMSAY